MGLSSNKQIKHKMLINSTIKEMEKQIAKLEENKKKFIEMGREAFSKGLTSQGEAAINAIKMTIAQLRRVQEMKLNFEITAQMKDVSAMTVDFLKGMSTLSKDMCKLTSEKQFKEVEKQFAKAMTGAKEQSEHMDEFMQNTKTTFGEHTENSFTDDSSIEALVKGGELVNDTPAGDVDSMIEKELEELRKKMTM